MQPKRNEMPSISVVQNRLVVCSFGAEQKKNSNKISYKETISVTQILMFDNSGCEELAKKLPVLGLEGLCGHLDTAVVWMQYKV